MADPPDTGYRRGFIVFRSVYCLEPDTVWSGKCRQGMEKILKIVSLFIALFMIADGIYVYIMPPYGDEPVAFAIIAMGIFIPLLTFSIARREEQAV